MSDKEKLKEEYDKVVKLLHIFQQNNAKKISNKIDPNDPNIFHSHLDQYLEKPSENMKEDLKKRKENDKSKLEM